MSIWVHLEVSAIGEKEHIAKLLNFEVGHEKSDWILDRFYLSVGMKNGSPLPIYKMSEKHPEIIFAVTSYCEGDYYRFLLKNKKYASIFKTYLNENVSPIDSHMSWVKKLSVGKANLIMNKPNSESDKILITDDSELYISK